MFRINNHIRSGSWRGTPLHFFVKSPPTKKEKPLGCTVLLVYKVCLNFHPLLSSYVSPLYVLWVVLQTFDELCDGVVVEADLVNSSEQRKLFHHVFLFQDLVDLARSRWTLKLLAVQQLFL